MRQAETSGQETRSTGQRQADAGIQVGSEITARCLLIGAVLSFFLNFLDAYATTMIRGSYLTLNFSTPASLLFFFFLLLLSGAVALVARPLALTRAELITIYLMLLIACCIPGMGFTQFIIPALVGSAYYATPENAWGYLYNELIPQWMVPRGEGVARYFFEGLPKDAPLPWDAWYLPLAYWYSFFLALSGVMICSMVIIRRQWVNHEKLVYPLVQVPMQMIQEGGRGIPGGPFLRSPAMWLGFGFAFLLLSVNGLHSYDPSFPGITRSTSLPLFTNGPNLDFWFSPPWIGFFYFVSLDISASIWVFYAITTVQRGIFQMVGLQSTERLDLYSRDPYLAHQGMGAMIIFVLIGLWVGRRHLAQVFRKAFKGDAQVDDADEILSYRNAVYGLLISLALVVAGLHMAGMPIGVALMFIVGAMVIFIGLTRAVAEGGVPAMRPPIMTSTFVIAGLGTSAIGLQGLVALGFTYGWHSEIRSFVMASLANGLKMAEGIRGSRRRLFWAVVIAILVSLVGSTWMTLHLAYKYGGVNLNPLFFNWGAATMGPTDMAPRLNDVLTGPRWDSWFFMGLGGVIMTGLMWVRYRFLWWPLSPMGYMISANWKTGHIFASALIAWTLKYFILKYGGPTLFRNLRPFFLGLILGEIVAAGVWLLIDFVLGHTDSFLTQI
jgi:hypothetical protein